MTLRERQRDWRAAERLIRRSREGCDCPPIDGVNIKASNRCSETWIRCNGSLRVMQRKLKKLGPMPTRAPGDTRE